MAKKKTSTKKPAQAKTQSTIAYKGSVKIQLMRGNKVYKTIEQHNEGTTELFRYLANALAGNLSQAGMPKYLHTFCVGSFANPSNPTAEEIAAALAALAIARGNELYGSNLSTCALNVPWSNVEVRYDSTTEGYNAEYTFMIPYSQIHNITNVLCLYNTTSYGDGITPLAFIKIENADDWLRLADNNTSNIVITWIMSVCNQTVKQ